MPLKFSRSSFGVAAGVQTNVEPKSGCDGVRVLNRSQEETENKKKIDITSITSALTIRRAILMRTLPDMGAELGMSLSLCNENQARRTP